VGEEGEEVVGAEGGMENVVEKAEEADEERLHPRDDERIVPEEDSAAAIEPGVENGVREPEQQDRVQDQPGIGADGLGNAQIGVGEAEQESEPADLDDDRLAVEVPAGHVSWRKAGHVRLSSFKFRVSSYSKRA